jgi:hypothetical protein
MRRRYCIAVPFTVRDAIAIQSNGRRRNRQRPPRRGRRAERSASMVNGADGKLARAGASTRA